MKLVKFDNVASGNLTQNPTNKFPQLPYQFKCKNCDCEYKTMHRIEFYASQAFMVLCIMCVHQLKAHLLDKRVRKNAKDEA